MKVIRTLIKEMSIDFFRNFANEKRSCLDLIIHDS